jgi:hypothetical protein
LWTSPAAGHRGSDRSAGVDHIDPAILKRYGKRMWWAAVINKLPMSELAVCYVVPAVSRADGRA